MLRLDLGRLGRDRSVRVSAEVPGDDPLWDSDLLAFDGPVFVDLAARRAGSGEFVVRGSARGTVRRECRRCLKPVLVDVEEDVTLVFVSAELASGDEGEARVVPEDVASVDLGEALREELILAVDPYVACDPACRGLCPTCGVDLNDETCECHPDEADPRWDALRALKNE